MEAKPGIGYFLCCYNLLLLHSCGNGTGDSIEKKANQTKQSKEKCEREDT